MARNTPRSQTGDGSSTNLSRCRRALTTWTANTSKDYGPRRAEQTFTPRAAATIGFALHPDAMSSGWVTPLTEAR